MSHKAQRKFFQAVCKKFPKYFGDAKVLDVGSLDINGCNRPYFDENCFYIGVDLGSGNNVDMISKGHQLTFVDDYFDVTCCSEVFEHDMHYKKTLQNMYRMLKPGGLMFFSCATTGRPEHGTIRSAKKDFPFTTEHDIWKDYYYNVTEEDVRAALDIELLFESYDFGIETRHHDLRFWGVKVQQKQEQEPADEDIHNDTDDQSSRFTV